MTGVLRFRLNGKPVALTDVAPTTTLLNWLRDRQGLTGTKEGCAEGDCGACTVALRSSDRGGLTTRPVCACIQLMGMVHGQDIVTVEALAAPDGRLHPVQQAMVDCHGSQCGFCTPGFVMSLWCAHRAGELPTTRAQNDLLAGNLCRCTGYGPILAAGKAAHGAPAEWEENDQDVAAALSDFDAGPLDYIAGKKRFIAPTTVTGLTQAIADHPAATILSGATDIGLWVTKHGFDPDVLIYTGRVAALTRIEEADGILRIGAAVTYAQALTRLTRLSPALGNLIRRIGARQVRAMGTIGGNIANGSPIGDMPPALIALGARLILGGPVPRDMALEDFFLAYGKQDLRAGEFVEAILVPIPNDPDRLACHKVAKRRDQDITAVLGCFDIQIEDGTVQSARLVFGGMAGTPKRASAAEAALTGQPRAEETVRRAVEALTQDFTPLSDHRGSAAYRMQTAQALLLRHWNLTARRAQAQTVWEIG